ncbi:uncharacterized protein V6R79_020068 [Siganus canaliculatus]
MASWLQAVDRHGLSRKRLFAFSGRLEEGPNSFTQRRSQNPLLISYFASHLCLATEGQTLTVERLERSDCPRAALDSAAQRCLNGAALIERWQKNTKFSITCKIQLKSAEQLLVVEPKYEMS